MDMMTRFLARVPSANWRTPPDVWNVELRKALNNGLVTVGWGGILKLTDAGRRAALIGWDQWCVEHRQAHG